MLKGAQSRDEQKSKEIFFNEILASDEIDVLYSPKVLHNFEFIGEHSVCSDFLGSASDASLRSMSNTPHSLTSHNPKNSSTTLECEDFKSISKKDNLLIKGNNLLALHTLKGRKDIYGEVKLIYIDPPYNTGNDSFNYNDRFEHSTWLTFMKNRLEIAKEFLRDDGVIFIQCDDNEQAYLKVLMDEIFCPEGKKENFVCTITCKVKAPSGIGSGKEAFFDCAEYILVYAKNKSKWSYKTLKIDTSIVGSDCDKTKDNYNKVFKKIDLDKKVKLPNSDNIFYLDKQYYEIENIATKDKTKDFYFININNIFRVAPNDEKTIRGIIADSKIECDFFIVEKENRVDFIYKNEDVLMLEKFCRIDNKKRYVIKMDYLTNIFTDDFWQGISSEGKAKLKNGKKPEALLKRIVEISTNEGDLVMDFFAGSGTTLAVAHKMGRRWVGIEQMDYVESITKERLKKVIAGEQGGVSKALGWSGGGGFLYLELMPLNAVYKDKITQATNENELEKLYKDLREKAFLDYRVDSQEVLQDKEFQELDLASKKVFLYQALDSNMDYVPLEDIADSDYDISSEIIELNKAFYGGEDE